MELALGIVGSATGILGLFLSILGYLHNRMEAIKACFEYERDGAFIDARRLVYSLGES